MPTRPNLRAGRNRLAEPAETLLREADVPRVALSLRKKIAFGLVTTLAALFALEAILAMMGVDTLRKIHDPYVGFNSAPHYELLPALGEPPRWRTARHKLALFNEQSFAATKSDKSFRIFCVGGSTTYGRPYADRTSYVGWVRRLLAASHPDLDLEVINAGGISYASYRVAALVDELVAYQPDLLIIYTGHNEFLEERTYGHLKSLSTSRRWLGQLAANSRTAAVLHRVIGAPRPPRSRIGAEVDEILDHTIGPSSYRRDPQAWRKTAEHYAFSLRRMIAAARRAGAGVLLVRPACNLRGVSPFKSETSEGLDREIQEEFERLLAAGRSCQAVGDHEAAVSHFSQAMQLDDQYAQLHFAVAQSQFALGNHAAAHVSFQRAVDLDVCPLRITTTLDSMLLEVARELQVPLIDFPALIADACRRELGHEIPGDEFFFDHVHPTIDSHGLLARAIVTRLVDERLIPLPSGSWENRLESIRLAIHASVTLPEEVAARANLARVWYWAGKFAEAGRIAVELVEQGQATDDSRLLLIAGRERLRQGDVQAARELLTRAQQLQPNDPRISEAVKELPASDVRVRDELVPSDL